jgi:DNA-binding NarL/FixJ family response regulator
MGSPDDRSTDIAVTIETAPPSERMALFCLASGLSPRESELVASLARGSDTRQLADELFISENTVQDHFKSIFTKTGIRSRRALMVRALGG